MRLIRWLRWSALIGGLATIAGCSTAGLLAAATPAGGATRTAAIAYGDDPRQQLDVYRPAATPPRGAPVVVFFYGGSWRSGQREDYRFVGNALAARGLVVVIADYRLHPQVSYPAFLADGAAAVAWTVREIGSFGGDPKHLFLMGHSAGGYNASMLALDARWLRAAGLSPSILSGWIGLAGAYDFLPTELPDIRPVFHHPDYPPGSLPIDHVRADAPPTFLGVATRDTYVDPQRNTRGLADRLERAGVPTEIHWYPRTNHMTLIGALAGPLRWFGPVLDDVTTFVRARSTDSSDPRAGSTGS